MSKFIRDGGLTIVLMALFLVSIIGQLWTGWRLENEELARHGEAAIGLLQFAGDPPVPVDACSRIGRASSCRCRPMSC